MGLSDVVSTTEVTGVAIDSRKVEPGNLFLAYRGTNHNGLEYINNAINAGAAVVVAVTTGLLFRSTTLTIFFPIALWYANCNV